MTKCLPNYKRCIAMMRSRDPQTQEDDFHVLLRRANEHVEALICEFQHEKDHGLRCWFLELIGDAKSPLAFELLASLVTSEDASLRHGAILGLKNLDTKDARRIVHEVTASPGSSS